MDLRESLIDLIRDCATVIPQDIEDSLRELSSRSEGLQKDLYATLIENCQIASAERKPICQDTGTPIFYVDIPKSADTIHITDMIRSALEAASDIVPLRANAVNSKDGVVNPKNTGKEFPVIYFKKWDRGITRFTLFLNGGDSENITKLYSLPDTKLGAERNLSGIKKCVLDAVNQAQGKGCPPYIVGVCVGGLTDIVLSKSKKLLLRKVGSTNPDIELNDIERELLSSINLLGIGPLGFGGKDTALSVFIEFLHRAPASYFVGISFSCWACRRKSIEVMI